MEAIRWHKMYFVLAASFVNCRTWLFVRKASLQMLRVLSSKAPIGSLAEGACTDMLRTGWKRATARRVIVSKLRTGEEVLVPDLELEARVVFQRQ